MIAVIEYHNNKFKRMHRQMRIVAIALEGHNIGTLFGI